MNSLLYLIAKSLKNRFFEILRKPSKLITYLVLILILIGIFILSFISKELSETYTDIIWLQGVLFALVAMFLVFAVQKGLNSGDKIFDMNDVNLLFVSPVNPRATLLYGVVKMMSIAFLTGFFILFQGNTLALAFGIGLGGVLLILAGFILAVILLQILSLLIYSNTNGNRKRKRLTIAFSVLISLPLVSYALLAFIESGGDFLAAAETTLRSPLGSWFPVSGWASAAVTSFISGLISRGLMFTSVLLGFSALLIFIIIKSNPDYYEDVLVATETAYEKKRSFEEGQINPEALKGKKIKVTSTGISGFGANVLFRKHLRESFRANRMGLWGLKSILVLAGVTIFALVTRNNESVDGLINILHILMWLQIFLIGTGRGLKELYFHYIYMIPEQPFPKLLWSNLEVVFMVFVESIFIFTVAGLIYAESGLLIAAAILVYTIFSLVLLGVNFLSLRLVDLSVSAGLLVILYMLAVMIIMLPGVVIAFIVGIGLDSALLGLLTLALWETIAAVLCLMLSRGLLHKCDMPSVSMLRQRI